MHLRFANSKRMMNWRPVQAMDLVEMNTLSTFTTLESKLSKSSATKNQYDSYYNSTRKADTNQPARPHRPPYMSVRETHPTSHKC